MACLLIFLLGYIVYEDNMLLEKLIVNRYKYLITLISFAICGAIYTLKFRPEEINAALCIIDSFLKNGVLICAICTVIGFSSIYLNKSSKLLKYLNKYAFPIYIIHQPILLILACLIIPTVKSTTLSIALIIILSAILTFLVYEVLNKIKIFNFVFGIK